MAIYRGTGTSGTTSDSASVEQVSALSNAAANSATEAETSATQAATSAASALTSATNAAASEAEVAAGATAAENSATSAASSATSASSSASSASTSATAASGSATTAASEASDAADSATAAAASATSASGSASTATTKASEASTSATAAATSASEAATSATNAAASELVVTANATAAAASATAAASSASSASTSATAADSSASSASTSATTATTKASEASTSAANAASSASTATTKASEAATSATTATTKASEAATSATTATTKASEASSSASSAAASATAAQAAQDAALAALDSFDDRYLGTKASDPTLDNDGNALVAGALYFNTTDDVMKVYEGSIWVAAYASLSGALLQANNLSDLQSVVTARTNLGLGTAATTASTDYATAAQGALADSALQSFTETDPVFTAWDKSTGISITESQISDFGSYQPAGSYEPAFTKNTAFNKNFGTATGTVAQGDDSRINNGQTAYGWGNHTLAGYQASATALTTSTTFSGDVSGTYNAIVVADDSHNHIISNVDGLQTALDGKSATTHNHTLDGLSNTTITSNTSGEILKWNGTAWINNTLAEAGIQPAGSYLTGNQTITLTGDASGSGTTSIAVTVANDSHSHSTSTITGLGSLATLSAVGAAQITDNSVGAAELNVVGNGTAGQALLSDGDGTFSWGDAGGGTFQELVESSPSRSGTGYTETGTVAENNGNNTSWHVIATKVYLGGNSGSVSVQCGAAENSNSEGGYSRAQVVINGAVVASAASASTSWAYSGWVAASINSGQSISYEARRDYNGQGIRAAWYYGVQNKIDDLLFV